MPLALKMDICASLTASKSASTRTERELCVDQIGRGGAVRGLGKCFETERGRFVRRHSNYTSKMLWHSAMRPRMSFVSRALMANAVLDHCICESIDFDAVWECDRDCAVRPFGGAQRGVAVDGSQKERVSAF